MRQFLIYSTVLFVVVLLTGCSNSVVRNYDLPPGYHSYIIRGSNKFIYPKWKEWKERNWRVIGFRDDERIIYVMVYGQAPEENEAFSRVEEKRVESFTEALKEILTLEFTIAKNDVLDPESRQLLEPYLKKIITVTVQNVNIAAVKIDDIYWEYIWEINGSEIKEYYVYYILYALPYNFLKKARQETLANYPRPKNPELAKKIEKIIEYLKSAEY